MKNKQSKHSRDGMTDDLKVALGVVEASGDSPSDFAVEILKRVEKGELTTEEAVKKIKEHHNVG